MMMRRLGFCVLIALVLGAVMATPPVLADDPNRIAKLSVSLWPEYDQPAVLVMLDATLADAGNLPREVAVLIPSSASLLVTTYENADGTYASEQASKSSNEGDGLKRVTFTTKTANYHIEYYDNLLRGSPDKIMDFSFKSVVPIDQALVEIQQPLKATNFSVDLPVPTTRADDIGFKYYSYTFSNVQAGQSLTAQAKYTKTDSAPSVISTPALANVPVTAAAPAEPSPWSNIFAGVAVVLLGLVGFIGFMIIRSRQRVAAPAYAGRSKKSRRGRGPGAQVFCTQCGSTIGANDNFCPKCGAPRRSV